MTLILFLKLIIIQLGMPLVDTHNIMKMYGFFLSHLSVYVFLVETAYSYFIWTLTAILSELWVKIWKYDIVELAWRNTQLEHDLSVVVEQQRLVNKIKLSKNSLQNSLQNSWRIVVSASSDFSLFI